MIIEKNNYKIFYIFKIVSIFRNILYKILNKFSKHLLYLQKSIVCYNSIATQTDITNFTTICSIQNKSTQCNLFDEEIDEIINNNSTLKDIEKLDRNFSPTKHKWYFF